MTPLHRMVRAGARLAVCAGLATLSVGSACSSGGSGSTTGGPQAVQADVLAATSNSGLEARARIVVRDATNWELYRERLAGGSAASTGAVDFAREMVIVVAMGRRPTGGYSIQVDSVVAQDAVLLVAVTETVPGSTCMTTQAFTSPAAAVRVSRFEGAVRFAETARTRECN